MKKEYKFKAFGYTHHWQPWVVGLGMMLIVIVLPFLIYVSYIYTGWKDYKTPLSEILLHGVLILIPFSYLYFFVMHKMFYKNYNVSIDDDLITVTYKDGKNQLRQKVSQLIKVKIVLKKQTEKNQVIIIEIKPKNKRRLIVRSGIKGSRYTKGYDSMVELESDLSLLFQKSKFDTKIRDKANKRLIIKEYF